VEKPNAFDLMLVEKCAIVRLLFVFAFRFLLR